MCPAFTQQSVSDCFQEIKNAQSINVNRYKEIINNYCPIHTQEIEPLRVIKSSGSHSKIKEHKQLEEEFYEQKFVPSPDLMASYQQTFIKSLRGQQPSALVNNKLMNLYGTTTHKSNMPYAAKSNCIQEPVTIPYRTLTNHYNQVPSQAQNKRVFVQQRQELILGELREKSKIGLQMSLPVIQRSLMDYEIRSLESKNVSIQNYGNLSAWKSRREQLENKLASK